MSIAEMLTIIFAGAAAIGAVVTFALSLATKSDMRDIKNELKGDLREVK